MSKFEQAKARARGETPAESPTEPTELITIDASTDLAELPADAGDVVRRIASPADLARAAAGMDLAPRFITLTEGDAVKGVFERHGFVMSKDKKPDPVTGEYLEKKLETIVLRAYDAADRPLNFAIEFLSAHALKRQLAMLEGAPPGVWEVLVVRGKEKRVGNNVVTDYVTSTKQLKPVDPRS